MPRNRSPLREQSFRIATMAISVVVGIVAVVVVEIVLGVDTWIWLTTLIVGILIGLGAALVGALIGARVARRLVGDRIEVALRDSGETKWRHGRLSLSPDHVSFQPYALQMRIPKGDPIEMRVTRLGDDTGRRPSRKQIWTVNPQLHIVDMATDTGAKELAALPSRLAELRSRLAESPTT